MRWCSDGLEIKCDSGETVATTFAKDGGDRVGIAWRAWEGKGMAERFVNTFKRDCVAQMDRSDAATVLAQLPAAFEHFNEVHPHSSWKKRSPSEFRRHQTAPARQSPIRGTALRCE